MGGEPVNETANVENQEAGISETRVHEDTTAALPASDKAHQLERTPSGLSISAHCQVAILAVTVAAVGNVIAYRIVVSDFLLGKRDSHFAEKISSSMAVVVALLYLFGSHCMLLGANSMPKNMKKAVSLQLVALGTLFFIVL